MGRTVITIVTTLWSNWRMITRHTLEAFNMSIKYKWQPRKGKTIYYRRRIPSLLEHHYSKLKSPFITKSTGTSNHSDALAVILRINEDVKKDWALLQDKDKRALDNSQNLSDAQSHLQNYSITPQGEGPEPFKDELFDDLTNQIPYDIQKTLYDSLNDGDPYYAELRDQAIKNSAQPHKYRALQILREGLVLQASEYVSVYADLKGLDTNSKQIKDVTRDIKSLVEHLGDRPPHEYSKMEINDFIKARLDTGVSTGTIRRNFNSLNAVFNKVNTEHEIDQFHRFKNPNIPNLGEDKKERKDFTQTELLTLRKATINPSNVTDQIIGLLIDTGMRCSEVVGLSCKDIILNAQQPYLTLHKNTHRRLKTKNSHRNIPLVGTSLGVAKNLNLKGDWVFNQYLHDANERFKTTSANNTVNNRIRVILKNESSPSSHSFRHTLMTRLRDVECPEYIRKEIGGWAATLSEKYGSPTDLKVKAEYLKKSI